VAEILHHRIGPNETNEIQGKFSREIREPRYGPNMSNNNHGVGYCSEVQLSADHQFVE
jgi:hypothetical protein